MATKTLSAYAAILSYPIKDPETVSYTATWSNLGPLTTVFTPPVSCNTPVATNLFVQGRTTWAHDCDWTRTADLPRSDCYPSYTAPDAVALAGGDNFWLPGEQKFYYSPGYSCPAGWQAATTLTTPAPATVGVWDEGQRPLALLDATGTQVVCCPNAWTMGGLVQCYSRVEISTTIELCREETRAANHTNRELTSGTTSTMVAYTTPAVLLVYDDGTAPVQGNSSSNTIKIAVGVVVPVVALLSILAGVLFCIRRRKRRSGLEQPLAAEKRSYNIEDDNKQPAELANTDHVGFAKPELDGSDPSRRLLSSTKPELDGSNQYLSVDREVAELEGAGVGQEGVPVPERRCELGYATQAASEVPVVLQPPRDKWVDVLRKAELCRSSSWISGCAEESTSERNHLCRRLLIRRVQILYQATAQSKQQSRLSPRIPLFTADLVSRTQFVSIFAAQVHRNDIARSANLCIA